MWSLITLIVVLLVGAIAYAIYGHHHHLAPSTGEKINLPERPNSALLIVDLQEDFTNATGKNAYAPDLVEKRIAATTGSNCLNISSNSKHSRGISDGT